MIYLDYSATTPVDEKILDTYCDVTRRFIGNPNSKHKLGELSKQMLLKCERDISYILNCKPNELIFTSGASESNTMAIRCITNFYNLNGKHIITSYLEHKSILDEMKRLRSHGYEIEYVNINSNGLVDLKDLERKIRNDTILISICGVNSEVGYIQDLQAIRSIINKKNSKAIFHSDLTQALGKVKIDLSCLDLATFSSHKIYAPKGCGILYKKENVNIDTLISGVTSNTPYRGGTPSLPLIVAFSSAISIENRNLHENSTKCKVLKRLLLEGLTRYPIKINSNDNCIGNIVNISLLTINGVEFVQELEKYDIFVSTTSACCSDHESVILNKINNNDKAISTTSIRISISHLTTISDIDNFLKAFKKIFNNFNK